MRSWLLQAVVSSDVLIEAERNILEKLSFDVLSRYRQLLAFTPFLMVPAPPEPAVRQYGPVFFEDAHVVASSLAAQTDFLITLDQRLERRVKQANLGIVAISPREFLQTVFPQHPEYPRIRQQG